jgi:outer membrane protein
VSVQPLTADEAARIALARQPTITAARGAIVAAQGLTQQQRSGLLPTLGVGASYTKVWDLSGQTGTTGTTGSGGTTPGTPSSGGTGTTGTTGTLGTSSGFQASATVRQLIYDFNYTRSLVRQARALERAAEQNLSATQADVVLQVKQAFYLYVQNQRLVTVNEQNLSNRQSQLDLANARFRVGLGLPSDVATAQTAVSTAVQSLTVARNNASLAGVNLAQLMGIDPRTPIQPAESGEPPLPSDDVNGFVQRALRQRPEILQAQATIQADQHALSAAKVFNAPALTANLGPNAQGPQFFPQSQTFRIGVSLQFTPFDGGFTSGLVKEARGNLESARAQLSSQQLTVTSDVSQAYLDVRSAEQRVAAAGSEVANAQEGVRIATGRYRAGLGQFVDILNAQQFLFTALNDQVTAQSALEQARAAFTRAIGSPVAGAR